jgi:hypothetical protein
MKKVKLHLSPCVHSSLTNQIDSSYIDIYSSHVKTFLNALLHYFVIMGKSKHDQDKKQVDVLEQLRKLAKEQKKKDSKKKTKRERKDKKVKKDMSMTPMTKQDYEKKHDTIRTQLDPQTGRLRQV